jgi:hypothetical protein
VGETAGELALAYAPTHGAPLEFMGGQ